MKEVYFCQAEDKAVKRDDLVKGYEVSKNEYVVVEKAELDKIAPQTAKTMTHTMFFAGEIQQVEVRAGAEKFSAQELKLAGQLIDTLTAKFDPSKFQDEYQANVRRLIEQKQNGERVTATKTEKPARVVNILDALRKSLAENKTGVAPKKPRAKSRKRRAA